MRKKNNGYKWIYLLHEGLAYKRHRDHIHCSFVFGRVVVGGGGKGWGGSRGSNQLRTIRIGVGDENGTGVGVPVQGQIVNKFQISQKHTKISVISNVLFFPGVEKVTVPD